MNGQAVPGTGAARADWARFYCGELGLALVPIPPGSKGPVTKGWNREGGYLEDAEAAHAHWRANPRENMGAVLGPSGLLTLDGDQLEWTGQALAAVGLSLEALLAEGAALEGNPQKAKRVFRAPGGGGFSHRKLHWPDPERPEHPITVFELRGGAVQDVLPPSLHPGTGKPYRWLPGRAPWELGGTPPLPPSLGELWTRWDELLPRMEAACPWRKPPALAPALTAARWRDMGSAEGWAAVRAELNRRLDLEAVLERLGAERRGARSYLCPFHEERNPSFWVYDGGEGHLRWICAHGGAPVGRTTRQGWSSGDALDLVAHQRGGSVGRVTAELARELDVPLPPGEPVPLPEPPPEGAVATGEGLEADPFADFPADFPALPADVERTDGDEEAMPLPVQAVEPFPLEVLPLPLRRLVAEASVALPCPPDFLAVPLLAALGSAIGTSRELAVKGSWSEGPRIYCGIVAEPGSKKSPALTLVLEPLMGRQSQMKQAYEARKEEHRHELGRHELALEGWKKALKAGTAGGMEMPVKPEEPVMAQLVAGDATLEALAQLMEQNPRGLLFARDELTGWARSMDAYRNGKGADRQTWLSFWSGQAHLVNRKSSKEPLVLENPFVCVTGCLPPDVLGELSDERGREDGFIHRMLLAYPDPVPLAWSEAEIGLETRREYGRVLERLWSLEGDEGKPRTVRLTPEARGIWGQWLGSHYGEMNDPNLTSGLKGPWAKLEGYAVRLALILHLGRWVCGETASEALDRESMLKAVVLVEYFKSHARRVYGRLHATDEDRRVMAAVQWIERQGGHVKARKMQRSGVCGVRTTEDVRKLFEVLRKRGHGKLERLPRNALAFRLNSAPDTRQLARRVPAAGVAQA